MSTMPVTVSAIILAGGEGRRAGGRDKGLIDYRGRPLIEHVIDRIQPQAGEILISANRNLDRYRRYTDRVFTDAHENYRGPLAGIDACLPHCRYAPALVVACDMPQLPPDLVTRLHAAMTAAQADISIATVAQNHQLALLLTPALQASIRQRLATNRLKLIDWIQSQQATSVAFDDTPQSFSNLNRLRTD